MGPWPGLWALPPAPELGCCLLVLGAPELGCCLLVLGDREGGFGSLDSPELDLRELEPFPEFGGLLGLGLEPWLDLRSGIEREPFPELGCLVVRGT